jgi:hypothetical protein
MTTVLLWKEYRQQRTFWLVMIGLALLVTVCIAEMFGTGNGWYVFRDRLIHNLLAGSLLILAIVHGVATGGMLLAGDKDDGAISFLDGLTGRRTPVFAVKVAAGLVLVLSQSIALAGLSLGLGFGTTLLALQLVLMGVDGLIWGLLAGSLCRTNLSAVVAGLGLVAFSWFATPFVVVIQLLWRQLFESRQPDLIQRLTDPMVGKFVLGLTAGYVTYCVYCRDDFSRQPRTASLMAKLRLALPSSCWPLLWLAYRQGRWVVIGCVIAAFALALMVASRPLIVWPVGTMALGLACGLAVFVIDQRNGSSFLGAQRFPVATFWTVKIAAWAILVAVLTFMARSLAAGTMGNSDLKSWPWADPYRVHVGDPQLYLLLWPLYGFCFGQFFGLVTGRSIVAIVLGAFVTPLITLLWVPSLLAGNVPLWQILVLPAILLVTTRLAMWPWVSGRLATAKPLLGLTGAFGLMAATLASCFWYRSVEVPDVGEPFDLKEFKKNLTALDNQAGDLMHTAAKMLGALSPNTTFGESESENRATQLDAKRRALLLDQVLVNGWSKTDEKEVGRWLDELFLQDELDWATKAEEAAKLPLGVIRYPWAADSNAEREGLPDFLPMARLFTIRALQLQGRGDSRGALSMLETTLALSRQVQNYSTGILLDQALRMEYTALIGMRLWLDKVGPDKELLRAAQEVVERHRKECPNLANSIKSLYFVNHNAEPALGPEPRFLGRWLASAYNAPWEKERRDRVVNAVIKGLIGSVEGPVNKWYSARRDDWKNRSLPNRIATWYGLPPLTGPGAEISGWQWGTWLEECPAHTWSWLFDSKRISDYRERQVLNVTETLVALCRYQAEHGKPAENLAELVPAYLSAVPLNTNTGLGFHYAVSEGEQIQRDPEPPLKLAPGQGYIYGRGQLEEYFPVPVWRASGGH